MAAGTQQQVEGLLADLAAALDAEQSTGDAATPDPDELGGLAERADDLLSSTDLSVLAAASGLGAEGDPPSSLPEAIGTGEPQDVATLRSLLTLAKLSTADADRADELVSELQSLADIAQLPAAEAAPSDAGAPAAAGADRSDDDTPDDEEPPLRARLRSRLEETQTLFDQLPKLERLTEGLDEDGTDAEPSSNDAESRSDGAEPGDETGGETAADQSTRSRDGTRWQPGGRRTTHSTVPGAGRRDIGRRPGRFSTARGSTVSKR